MKKGHSSRGQWQLLLLVTCVLFTPVLWGQGGDSKGDNATQSQTAKQSEPAPDEKYVIGVDDVLSINVWKEPEVSRSVPVRSDGKITLPLVGELTAAGRTPRELKSELSEKLKSYISEPEVTVIVQEMKSRKFNILGMVSRPGSYPLTSSLTVLDGLALAGGFRDFAKKKSIYVLRKKADGTQERLPFNYKDVIEGKRSEQNVRLQPGDTVVVP